ncbi:MAG: MFS transporter [Moorellaceae bacterium]
MNADVGLVNTALGDIAKAFPNVDPTLISMVSTLPVLFMIPCTFIAGKLSQMYSKKTILIYSLMIYIIGGVGSTFVSNTIYQLLFMRALVGIGAGLSAPLSGSIIAALYEGNERAMMLGLSNAFTSAMAVVTTMLAGWLCVINWKYTFLAYAIFLLVLILELLALPSIPPEKVYKESSGESERRQIGWQVIGRYFTLALFTFACLIAGMLMMIKLAIYVMNEGIGNAVTTATAMSANTVAAFISSVLFAYIYRIFKRYTLVIFTVFTMLAYILLLNAHSASAVTFAMFVNGFGMGLFMPSLQLRASQIGTKDTTTFAMSFIMGAMFFGQFMASFVEKILALFGNLSIKALFTLGAICFAVYTAIYIIWVIMHPEKNVAAEGQYTA